MKRADKRRLALAAGGVAGVAVATFALREMLGLKCGIIDKLPLEPLAPALGPGPCDLKAKPGVEAFRDFVLEHFGGGDQGIINRGCGATGPGSDHYTGSAWDWRTIPWPASSDKPYREPELDKLLGWLLAPDCHGRGPAAMARRAGLKYVLWLNKGWRAWATNLAPAATIYTIPASVPPHLNHAHFSFSVAGAAGNTSLYRYL